MKVYTSVKLSRKALLRHKARTLLALTGIAIGVAAVIIMVAIGNGAQREVLRQIDAMGANLLVVNAGKAQTMGGRALQMSKVTTLKLRDSKAILEQCPSVQQVAPAQDQTLKVKYGALTTQTKILGTTSSYEQIRNFPTQRGRYFTPEENKATIRVAVIGSKVRDNLFEGVDPIGEIIRIGRVPFEVIGVLKTKGLSVEGNANEDNQIIIPMNTALRRVFNLNYLKMIYVQVKDEHAMDRAGAEISAVLRAQHRLDRRGKPDDFALQDQMKILEARQETTGAFTTLIAGLAGLSLFVGGAGILAIMLLVVKERTNEIGLRMAVGARPRDVLVQFLVEALILGLAGGFAGVLFGVLTASGLSYVSPWPTAISAVSILISVGFSLSIGLFFGVYPARRAALLNPIEALRAE